MGLDLYLYTKATYNRHKAHYVPDEELAYGRKTWSIYNFFRDKACGGNDDWEIELDGNAIQDFLDIVKPYYNVLLSLSKYYAYKKYDYDTKSCNLSPELQDAEQRFLVKWKDAGGDNNFTLGWDWELRAIIRWYEALVDIGYTPRAKYIMIASY